MTSQESADKIATYTRASTDDQVRDHQRTAIGEWLDDHGHRWEDVEEYADVGSGASDDREGFQQLFSAIEEGRIDTVVVWEISRLSRKGSTMQQFFDTLEDTGTRLVVVDGALDAVEPDGTGRFIADVVAAVYQQERRQMIQRIEAGVARARREGKWLGQVPAGFRRDDRGYLRPNLNPAPDEVGYFEMRDALQRIGAGESYRSVASELPITRQTLSAIDRDEERRQWYIDGEADEKGVEEALAEL